MSFAFFDDYSEGAHPAILEAITRGNDAQMVAYGKDELSHLAAKRICQRFDVDADVHFTSSATQANLIGIGSMLRSYQGVIAPSSAHINVHEAGAIEATGHKILSVAVTDGKLTPEIVDRLASTPHGEHQVMPKVVCLTQATEVGSVYSGVELQAVVECAHRYGMYVFVDGARLAMAFEAAQLTSEEFAATGIDMFTVGGTKVGGMFGEAIVIANPLLRQDFRYCLKQNGALLAKGRFLGSQFARFFAEDDLWLELGRVSNAGARRLSEGLESLGVRLGYETQTNQAFPILHDDLIAKLRTRFGFYDWEPAAHDSTVVRLTCSWATPNSAIDSFLEAVRKER